MPQKFWIEVQLVLWPLEDAAETWLIPSASGMLSGYLDLGAS